MRITPTDNEMVNAQAVSNFLYGLTEIHPDRFDKHGNAAPDDDFAYGHALAHWQQNGRDSQAFFSTEDPIFLEFAREVTETFGLSVVTFEEALKRAKKQNVITVHVCEAGLTDRMPE